MVFFLLYIGERIMMMCTRNGEAIGLISFYDEAYNIILLFNTVCIYFLVDYRPINYMTFLRCVPLKLRGNLCNKVKIIDKQNRETDGRSVVIFSPSYKVRLD